MIVRIVKVTLLPGKRSDFICLFRAVSPAIQHATGCISVDILTDLDNPDVAFTISRWKTTSALASYRESELFRRTWSEVRKLFASRAQAWTLDPEDPLTK